MLCRFYRDASRKEIADFSFMHGSYLLEHFLKAKLKLSRSQILKLILNHYDFDQNNVKKKRRNTVVLPSVHFIIYLLLYLR